MIVVSNKNNIQLLILVPMLIGTVLNRYVITDRVHQWFIVMLLLAFYLVVFARKEWKRSKSKTNLVIMLIFGSELIAVLMGFNLSTQYYSEFIIVLSAIGLYTYLKNLKNIK